MAKIRVGDQEAEYGDGKRLVLAIEDMGVNIGHRCGGQARCTTCRVQFISGEPSTMTIAEYEKLGERELRGEWRLSCQILLAQEMEVEVGMTLESEGWSDTGPRPDDQVQPTAEWFPIEELEAKGEGEGDA